MSDHHFPRRTRLPRPILPLVLTALLAGCKDSPSGPAPLLGGNAELRNGVLTVSGSAAGHQIRIEYTSEGIEVERDGERTVVREPVRAIEVEAGGGDNVVRYRQLLVADIDLSIRSGGGDDEIFIAFEPSGTGDRMDVTVAIDTDDGSDRVDFSWNGTALPALAASVKLNANGTAFLPDVGDEIVVGFQSGDPDRPVILGSLYNGQGTADGSSSGNAGDPAGGRRSFGLEAEVGPAGVDIGLMVRGGVGPDSLEVSADYSGVWLQQGRLVLDADLNEGDNAVHSTVVTSAAESDIRYDIAGGDGRNALTLDDRLGGSGEIVYAIDLGDGGNEATIRFGDGVHGAAPSPGDRSVTAVYRSGQGDDTLDFRADAAGPISTELTLDLGGGLNATTGVFTLDETPAAHGPPSGGQVAPSQTKVIIFPSSGGGNDLDDLDLRARFPLRMSEGGSDGDGSGDGGGDSGGNGDGSGEIVVSGTGVLEGRIDFLRLLGTQPTPGSGSREDPIVYLQEEVVIAPGGALDVRVSGGSGDGLGDGHAILAHLVGLSGGGPVSFLAEGGEGGGVVAALTRDLAPGDGGEMTFDVRGGEGDDVVALAPPPVTGVNVRAVHRIDGGPGTNRCFAPAEVPGENCGEREGITEEILALIDSIFGGTYAAEWASPTPLPTAAASRERR